MEGPYRFALAATFLLAACDDSTVIIEQGLDAGDGGVRSGGVCYSHQLIEGPIEKHPCAAGLYCDMVTVPHTGTLGGSCKPIPQEGEACSTVCAEKLKCIRSLCQTDMP